MKIKHNQKTYFFLLFIFLVHIFLSCSGKEATNDAEYAKLLQQSSSERVTTHRWFYFTSDGFKETDIPRNAPEVESHPWTEAIRITSSAFIDEKSYFAVNKLGLMQAPQTFGLQKNGIASETKLIKDTELFSKSSVANMYYIDGTLLFNFYTNSIFEESMNHNSTDTIEKPFLVEFDTSTFNFEPVLTNIDLSEYVEFEIIPQEPFDFLETEIREVFYDNNTWNMLFKSNQTQRTDFYAMSITADTPITTNQNQTLHATMKSVNEYREIAKPKPSTTLPQTIQTLLKPVPSRVSYYLNYAEENSPSTMQYAHLSANSRPIQGFALGLEHCSIAVFEDGTICFAGALPSKSVLNNGETKAFTLPDLGPGYVYGSIALSGSTLYVAWEETSFYETGRSGFLAVDMEQVLYNNTITGE